MTQSSPSEYFKIMLEEVLLSEWLENIATFIAMLLTMLEYCAKTLKGRGPERLLAFPEQ